MGLILTKTQAFWNEIAAQQLFIVCQVVRWNGWILLLDKL